MCLCDEEFKYDEQLESHVRQHTHPSIKAEVKFADKIEKLREKYPKYFQRPGVLFESDSRGHVWYCFKCQSSTGFKDHLSFNQNKKMYQHICGTHYELISWRRQ